MKKYIVRLRSTTPLLLNVRQKELDDELKTIKKDELSEWEEKNWKKKAERDSKGNIILPIRWFRSSFIQACKSTMMVPYFAYSYGRKFNQDRIRETIIKLPFKNGDVDWGVIEDYIKGLNYSKHLEIKH